MDSTNGTVRLLTVGGRGFAKGGGRESTLAEETYGPVLDRVRGRLADRASRFSRERIEAVGLVAELLRRPPAQRVLQVRNRERFRSLAVARALIDAGARRGMVDALEGEELAALALDLCEQIEVAVYGRGMVADTQALAWAQIADSRRRRRLLAAAEEALCAAEARVQEGTGEASVRARLLAVEALLRRHQMSLEESERLLDKAVRLYRQAGDGVRLGQALMQQAELAHDAGDHRRARWSVRRALRHLRAEGTPREVHEACQTLIACEVELGNFAIAERLLAEGGAAVLGIEDPRLGLRRRWLAGRVATGLGRYARGEDELLAAKRGFEELGAKGDAALAALDLAALYHRAGRRERMAELVAEVLPYFASHASHRELSVASRRLLETSGLLWSAQG